MIFMQTIKIGDFILFEWKLHSLYVLTVVMNLKDSDLGGAPVTLDILRAQLKFTNAFKNDDELLKTTLKSLERAGLLLVDDKYSCRLTMKSKELYPGFRDEFNRLDKYFVELKN
jgi:hypothetical protein